MIDQEVILGVGAVLFCIGLFGALIRRNLLVVLMSIELMLNAVNLTFIGFSRIHADINGQAFAFMVIALAAAEAAVGLAIVVAVFKNRGSVYADDVAMMKH